MLLVLNVQSNRTILAPLTSSLSNVLQFAHVLN